MRERMCIIMDDHNNPDYRDVIDICRSNGWQVILTPLDEPQPRHILRPQGRHYKTRHFEPGGNNLRMQVRDILIAHGGTRNFALINDELIAKGYNPVSGKSALSWLKQHGYVEYDKFGMVRLIKNLSDDETVEVRQPKLKIINE